MSTSVRYKLGDPVVIVDNGDPDDCYSGQAGTVVGVVGPTYDGAGWIYDVRLDTPINDHNEVIMRDDELDLIVVDDVTPTAQIDSQIITETPASAFPACKSDGDLHGAVARRFLWGDISRRKLPLLQAQIDEKMRRLSVASTTREILNQEIDHLERSLAALFERRNQLTRSEPSDALDR